MQNHETDTGRKPTEREIAEDIHNQHFHKVLGRKGVKRDKSKQYVVDYLESILKMPTCTRGRDGRFCDTTAKLNEGQRLLAQAILLTLEQKPVTQTQKPKVKK